MKANENRPLNIYGLFDPRNKELRYIGATVCSLKKRLKDHRNDSNITHRTNWIKSLKELGLQPEIEQIDEVNISQWAFWENFYIDYYKSIGCRLTNMATGGPGPMLGKPSPNRGKKMKDLDPNYRNYWTGKKLSKESIEKGKATRLTNGTNKHTDESKKKISESLKGNQFAKGKKYSQEIRYKMGNGTRGKKMSEDWCRKLGERKKGNKNRVGNKNSERHRLALWKSRFKLTFKQVYEIFNKINDKTKVSIIADEFMVTESTIWNTKRKGIDFYKQKEQDLIKHNLL